MADYRSPMPDTGSWVIKTARGARVRWYRSPDWHGLPPPCSEELEEPGVNPDEDGPDGPLVADGLDAEAPEAIHAAR